MNQRRSFQNKLVYIVAMVVLILPLRWIGLPETPSDPQAAGKLAQLQREYGLAQTALGEIDPASETMKLATLGLRGIATQLLWSQANKAKMEENWTQLTATLEQLAKLQPNYITFWKFQSWNVSYNVSVQFDDYRDRYYYVRRGIEFLKQGIDLNRENSEIPQLLWDLGWFYGQKIGRADEYVQYRRLFRNDDEFHGDRPMAERDNWLVSKVAYIDAVDSIDIRKKNLGKKSPKIVYSSPAKSQMSYGEAIEEEGEFVQGQRAWVQSEKEWREFGDRPIEHSTGVIVFLGQEEQAAAVVSKLEADLDALAPGTKDKLVQQKRDALSEDERAALDVPADSRTPKQAELAYGATDKIAVGEQEIATAIAGADPSKKTKAFAIAGELNDARTKLVYTQRYKTDANYDYWLVRSQFEQTPDAVAARENMFLAKQAFKNGERERARELYETGFAKWRAVFDAFPVLLDREGTTGDDILVFIEDYRRVLNSLDVTIPDEFALWDIIENFDPEEKFVEELREHKMRVEAASAAPASEAEAPPDSESGEESPEDDAPSDDDADETEAPASEGA